ncbi:biotin--[acetyl-CoA-carboxylase] ligase [Microbacterium sp. cx-59]|uniref:biotin--[acetyl-CoA-carboxylase] ligase n=1 Tax=Microbacterium sp. cx-59 TaxID=2891207 RepID=UPI001E43DE74|nr:biotin--[acetyl-CoA-carboxylase] ligase [Microbacterium sp. cx-59]MCC4907858.1 biotin--[acetyl-CoA-carboxylase] ligase [Microbacterium sp. cx-59]
MSIPAEGFPLAAAISPRLQVVETTDSTNADVVAAVLQEDAGWPHLSAMLTTDQRHGRGRLDRTWTAPAGTALAVSVVVRVPGIPAQARGWVPLIAGAAMTRAVAAQLPESHDVGLKWPNDVLADGGKISGILAEAVPNHPDAIVIGAGVNTRMPQADLPVSTAVSFEVLGRAADDDRLLADYLSALDELLQKLIAAGGDATASGIRDEITRMCTTIDARVRVSLPDDTVLEGRADRLDEAGRLVVVTNGAEVAVAAGDVTHVRPTP